MKLLRGEEEKPEKDFDAARAYRDGLWVQHGVMVIIMIEFAIIICKLWAIAASIDGILQLWGQMSKP